MFDALIKRHTPAGWHVRWSKKSGEIAAKGAKKKSTSAAILDAAWGDYEKREIKSPPVVDAFTLHIFLHECAHVLLKHWTTGESSHHQEEYEAEMWALNAMRSAGIAVPKSVSRGVMRYMRYCVEKDEARGVAILPHIKRFTKRTSKYV